MLNNRVLAVIKRELREKIMSKAFIISTLAFPVIMVLIIGFQVMIATFEGESDTNITLLSESPNIQNSLENKFSEKEWVKNGKYKFNYETISQETLQEYLDSNKTNILEEKLTGIVFVSDSALINKQIKFYAKGSKNIMLEQKLGGVINQALIDIYFEGKEISDEDISFARRGVNFDLFKVTKEKEFEEESGGNLALAYVFSFLLYISLLMMGSMAMQSVIEEKTNRIVELILSSVNAKEFMTGKILGSTITGVLQMGIWLSPILIIAGFSLQVLPEGLVLSLNGWQVLYFMFNFFIGLITFVGLFSTVGSIYETAQEAQSGMFPIMMLIIIPFFITFTMIKNPTNTIALVSSMFPFASIIVMPARMTLVDVPIWQFILCLMVNIGTIMAIFPFAGKIYRVGILRSGKKPSIKEIVKWIKFKY